MVLPAGQIEGGGAARVLQRAIRAVRQQKPDRGALAVERGYHQGSPTMIGGSAIHVRAMLEGNVHFLEIAECRSGNEIPAGITPENDGVSQAFSQRREAEREGQD